MSEPERPRLGDHVRARRHLRGDHEASVVVLHDERAGRAMQLGEREWTVASVMDGTRDAEGVRRAARARGAAVSRAHVEAFVSQLDALGLLATGAEDADDASAPARDRPIVPLPGWGFACDGRGGCCRTFATIVFTPLEVAVARATRPDVGGAGDDPARLFTPERGVDERLFAGALSDGACAYLEAEGACGLHAAGGADKKPLGCRTFPIRFLDVGDAIRMAPRLECACAFEPAEAPPPLRHGTELAPATFVPRLGPIRAGADTVAPEVVLAWADALAIEGDVATLCASLADAIEREGRAALETERGRRHGSPVRSPSLREGLGEGLRSAGDPLPPPFPEGGGPSPRSSDVSREAQRRKELELIGAVDARMAAIRAAAARLASALPPSRPAHDLVRRAANAIANASDEGPPRDEAERLYVRALLFAPPDDDSLEHTLRGAAARIRLARAISIDDDPAARHPLALVEALARAHGID